jgi:hypothetical protein
VLPCLGCDILHSKSEQRQALKQLLQVTRLPTMLLPVCTCESAGRQLLVVNCTCLHSMCLQVWATTHPVPVCKISSTCHCPQLHWLYLHCFLCKPAGMGCHLPRASLQHCSNSRTALSCSTALPAHPQVWAATHPVPVCKTGAADALQKLNTVWPEGQPANKAELQALKVCGDCSGQSLCTGAGHTDAMAALAGMV